MIFAQFCVTWCKWQNHETIPWSISSSFSIVYNHNTRSCNPLFRSNVWHVISSIQAVFSDIHQEIQELNDLLMILMIHWTIYNICQPYQQLSSIKVAWDQTLWLGLVCKNSFITACLCELRIEFQKNDDNEKAIVSINLEF